MRWTTTEPIIGRESELATVLEMIQARPGATVTVVGPGGVGKTRLTRHVGEMLAEIGPVWFVPLASVAGVDQVPAAIAGAGGWDVSAEPGLAWPTLCHLLARERLTLILDNLEHLPDVGEPLADIAALSTVTILATSRRAIGLDDEQVFELDPLATADSGRPDSAPSAAATLFLATGSGRVDASMAPEDIAAIESICRHLDGLPLAIELVASRLAVMSPQALSGLVAQRRESVLTLSNGHGDHHRTLQATIRRSFDVVSPDAQLLLQAMAIAVAGMTPDMAAAVLDGRDGDAADALRDLSQHHLVRRIGDPETSPRYAPLETIRTFAATRLDRNPDGGQIRRRLLDHLLSEAESGVLCTVQEYERALPTILALADRSFLSDEEEEIAITARLVVALCPLIESAGPISKGVGWLEQALFMLPDHHPLVPAILVNLGRLVDRQGHGEMAEGYLRRALALCPDDAGITAFGNRMLGIIVKERGHPQESLGYFQEALDRYSVLADVQGMVRTENLQASAFLETGDRERARKVWNVALDRTLRAGLREDEVRVRANLAFLAMLEGDLAEAIAQNEAVIADAVRLNYRYIEAQAEENLALAWFRLGDTAKATHHGLRAVERWRRYGNPLNEADICNGFAAIAWIEGDVEKAIAWESEAIAIYRILRQDGFLAFALVRLSCFQYLRGDDQRAVTTLQEAAALLPDASWPAGEAVVAVIEHGFNAARSGVPVDVAWVASAAGAHPAFTTDRDPEQWIDLIAAIVAPPVEDPRDVVAQAVLDSLSGREREVLGLIAAGKSNAEIAWELSISERTAIFHVSNILRKLDVTTRIDAATWAIRHRIA